MKAKRLTAIIALVMAIAVCVVALSPVVSAVTDKRGSITLRVKDSETSAPLANETFRLYFFAKAYEKADGVQYEMLPEYDAANVDISDLQDAYLPIHLAYFATSHSLEFTEKSTDEKGVVVFSDLTPGLYLVVPSEKNSGTASPFVISIPEYDRESKTWIFDIDASPKINGNIPDGSTNTYITVLKKWDTDGDHPDSIKVVLLRDLQVYETIELNSGNNWYYRWDGLSKEHIWNIIEAQVPDGFTVYYETSTNTVIITNRSDESGTTKPTTPDEGTTTGPSDGEDDDKDDLADTGQLNWPVPVFAIAGLLLFSMGWAILNFGKKESE